MADRTAFHFQISEVFAGRDINIWLDIRELLIELIDDLQYVCREVDGFSDQFLFS
jgi:hypothetical protein